MGWISNLFKRRRGKSPAKLRTFSTPSSEIGLLAKQFELAKSDRNDWSSVTSLYGEMGLVSDFMLRLVRARARHEHINNPWAKRAHDTWSTYLVRDGITGEARDGTKYGRRDLQAIYEDFWLTDRWDALGERNLPAGQYLSVRSMVTTGESFWVRVWDDANKPLPFRVRVLPQQYLDTSKWVVDKDQIIFQGIEYNRMGRKVAYWFHPEDPTGAMGFLPSFRVPAEDVHHLYDPSIDNQRRGVAMGHASLLPLKDLKELGVASIVAAKVAACMCVFIEDPNYELPNVDPEGGSNWRKKLEQDGLTPGMVSVLPGGATVKNTNPPNFSINGTVERNCLMAAASGYNIPYELLTGDMGNVNWTSWRGRLLDFYAHVDRVHAGPVKCLTDTLGRWTYEGMALSGYNRRKAKLVWSPPARPVQDPAKEYPAARSAIRSGLMTLREWWALKGRPLDKVLKEIAEDNALLDEAGIVLDTDPRKTTNSGQVQAELLDALETMLGEKHAA